MYAVDLVLCIDCTGSMRPVIDMVKDHAAHIHEDIDQFMRRESKALSALRVRVVAFRDLYSAGEPAMLESEFFDLPRQGEAFQRFIAGLRAAEGGHDPLESGLEALALAIRSPWATKGQNRRQVIVVWSDDGAHRLERAESERPVQRYPKARVPRSFGELTDWWNNRQHINTASRRLIMFAPGVHPWRDIAAQWEESILVHSLAGAGLSDQDYRSILSIIVKSVVADRA